MKVLVTGGTGLLGARLVPRLAAAGHQVRVMTHSGRKVVGAGSITGDLLTGAGVAEAVAGAECVVHLASSPRAETQKVDVLGTQGLVEMARLGELIRDGWYLPEYADLVRADIQAVVGATR